jgi:hypothetical protein
MSTEDVEAVLLGGLQQPRPCMTIGRAPTEGFDGLQENVLGRVGGILRLAEQELADEVDG